MILDTSLHSVFCSTFHHTKDGLGLGFLFWGNKLWRNYKIKLTRPNYSEFLKCNSWILNAFKTCLMLEFRTIRQKLQIVRTYMILLLTSM